MADFSRASTNTWWTIFGLVLMIGAVIAAMGSLRWVLHGKVLGPDRQIDLKLTGIDGKFYSFPQDIEGKRIFLIVPPDYFTDETKKGLSRLTTNWDLVRSVSDEAVLISRWHIDLMQNLQLNWRFPGTMLSDPSGTILHYFHKWKPNLIFDRWLTAIVSDKGEIIWAKIGKEPEFP